MFLDFDLSGLYLRNSFIARPDRSSPAWWGALIKNPFSMSGGANRLLVFFYLFLLPGKLIMFAQRTF
jgi:hypothetical protein